MDSKNFTEVSRKPRTAHRPLRTCVGCRKKDELRLLMSVHCVRVADRSKAEIVFNARHADSSVRALGRGAWLHYDVACFNRAVRRNAFSLSFKVRERKIDFLCPSLTDFESSIMTQKIGEKKDADPMSALK